MAGIQSQMDLFQLDLVIAIAPLQLMGLNAPICQSDVQTLAPPDSIVARLAGCQGDQLVHIL